MRGQPFPVAGALDDDLVAGVGQSVQSAVAQYGIVEETEPFFDGPVADDDEAGRAVAIEDELVTVGGLLGGEPVEAQVTEEEQVGSQEGPESSVQGVVHPGPDHGFEEVVGVYETDGVAGAEGIEVGPGAGIVVGGFSVSAAVAPLAGTSGGGAGVEQARTKPTRKKDRNRRTKDPLVTRVRCLLRLPLGALHRGVGEALPTTPDPRGAVPKSRARLSLLTTLCRPSFPGP